jgi:hypothetical protein
MVGHQLFAVLVAIDEVAMRSLSLFSDNMTYYVIIINSSTSQTSYRTLEDASQMHSLFGNISPIIYESLLVISL